MGMFYPGLRRAIFFGYLTKKFHNENALCLLILDQNRKIFEILILYRMVGMVKRHLTLLSHSGEKNYQKWLSKYGICQCGKWLLQMMKLLFLGRSGSYTQHRHQPQGGKKSKVAGASVHLRAGIFKKSMGARHRGGIGFSYRPARLHRLAEFIPWNQFRGPINI